jgi:hypothetical protein
MHLVELMGGAQGGLKPTVVARRAMAEGRYPLPQQRR